MKQIRLFILLMSLVLLTIHSAGQNTELFIANWEDAVPDQMPGPGVWQYFISSGNSQITANPVPDQINSTQNVLVYDRPDGEWFLTGFYYQDGIPISRNMTGIEFKIYGDSLVKCYAKITGIVDGVKDVTIIENAWPWMAPSGPKVWNTIMLPINGDAWVDDILTTILIFPNPQKPEASADTFYIDEVRFLFTMTTDSIVLNVHDTILESGESIYLEASIFPSAVSNQNITWSSSNTNVATVSSIGKVKAIGPGNADIFVKTEDGNITDTCHIAVISLEGMRKIHSGNLLLWPNPYTNGNLVMKLPQTASHDILITIYNLSGNAIFKKLIPTIGNEIIIHPELEPGMYLIEAESGGEKWNGKILLVY